MEVSKCAKGLQAYFIFGNGPSRELLEADIQLFIWFSDRQKYESSMHSYKIMMMSHDGRIKKTKVSDLISLIL